MWVGHIIDSIDYRQVRSFMKIRQIFVAGVLLVTVVLFSTAVRGEVEGGAPIQSEDVEHEEPLDYAEAPPPDASEDIETISFEEYEKLLSELGEDVTIMPDLSVPLPDLPEGSDAEGLDDEEYPEPLEPMPEPEPDLFAAAPFSGVSLKDLEQHLLVAEALHQEIDDYYKLACAYAAATSDDRYFRRSCEFHARAATRQTPEIVASIALLSNFVMIAVNHFDQQLEQILALADPHEWAKPEKRAEDFARLALLLEACYQHLQSLQQLHGNVESYVAQAKVALNNQVVAGKLPELLSNRNSQILAVIVRMNEALASMNRRIKRGLEQSSNALDYLCSTNDSLSIATSARQLLTLRQNFNELALVFNNFNHNLASLLEFKVRLHKQLWQTLEKKALEHDKNIHHVIAFLNDYPDRDMHDKASVAYNTASVYLPMVELINLTLAAGDEEQSELFAKLIEEIDSIFSW